ncbi:MAG: hypothetical protein JWQ51_401 [Tardiphaga sp.]|nr:hypothetical protein [Tardiphaga sp.]
MVEAVTIPARNVIDFAGYREGRRAAAVMAQAISARTCCHCGAPMGEGDRDEDCSSLDIGVSRPAPPKPRRMFCAE